MPFELGRPFGAPAAPDFQRRVLQAALELLQRSDGPVLVDFPDAPPADNTADAAEEAWACPVNLAKPEADLSGSEQLLAAVQSEIALMRPWYQESVRQAGGRHLDGLTNLDPDELAVFLVAFADDQTVPSPITGSDTLRFAKMAADDLKHFYYTGALAKPGGATDVKLGSWFYGESLAGELLLMIRERALASDDERVQRLGQIQLVPNHQAHRKPEI